MVISSPGRRMVSASTGVRAHEAPPVPKRGGLHFGTCRGVSGGRDAPLGLRGDRDTQKKVDRLPPDMENVPRKHALIICVPGLVVVGEGLVDSWGQTWAAGPLRVGSGKER